LKKSREKCLERLDKAVTEVFILTAELVANSYDTDVRQCEKRLKRLIKQEAPEEYAELQEITRTALNGDRQQRYMTVGRFLRDAGRLC
jgi:hypothetical protein